MCFWFFLFLQILYACISMYVYIYIYIYIYIYACFWNCSFLQLSFDIQNIEPSFPLTFSKSNNTLRSSFYDLKLERTSGYWLIVVFNTQRVDPRLLRGIRHRVGVIRVSAHIRVFRISVRRDNRSGQRALAAILFGIPRVHPELQRLINARVKSFDFLQDIRLDLLDLRRSHGFHLKWTSSDGFATVRHGYVVYSFLGRSPLALVGSVTVVDYFDRDVFAGRGFDGATRTSWNEMLIRVLK